VVANKTSAGTAVKVFGQLVYTFTATPEENGSLINATIISRDALVAAFTANTPTLFASAFPGTSLNCDASLSSAKKVTATGNALFHTGTEAVADWATVQPTSPEGWTADGAVAYTPILGEAL
jgi:hypothetical protein